MISYKQPQTAAGHGGKGVWPFAMVNNKLCCEVQVFFKFSDLHDPEADDLQI